MLHDKNHLEIKLVTDKEPKPESNNDGQLIAIAVTISVAIALFSDLAGLSAQVNRNVKLIGHNFSPNQSIAYVSRNNQNLVNPSNPSTASLPAQVGFLRNTRLRITDCNGIQAEGANFRTRPTTASVTIQGVVQTGAWVRLTGKTRLTDGILWHEAINESDLLPSLEPDAVNQINAHQIGWIADCFVK